MKGLYKNPIVVARKVGEENFLVPVSTEIKEMRKIYRLNDLGWFIWQSLDKVEDLKTLSSLISREFEVEKVVAYEDAEVFLCHLVRIGAVRSGGEKA